MKYFTSILAIYITALAIVPWIMKMTTVHHFVRVSVVGH